MAPDDDPILDAALAALAEAGFKHGTSEIALVLGSGFGEIEKQCNPAAQIAYEEVPGFARPTGIAGHECRLTQGKLWGRRALVLRGRYHAYEGFAPRELVFGIRVAHALGAKTLVLTNAAGAIRDDLAPGALMAVSDHLNLMGVNPLVGRARMPGAPRFAAMAGCYDARLTRALVAAGKAADAPVDVGVYAAVLGPSFETAAEVRMLRVLGADAVGMSTVPEAICGHALGVAVCALSLITNRAGQAGGDPHQDTLNTGRDGQRRIAAVLEAFFKATE